MDEQQLTPEQEAAAEALVAEFMRQLERVGVDMPTASPQLREIAPPVERQISDDEYEVMLTVDVSGIVNTLRRLPDRAGTDAFVAAYNARSHDSGAQAS
jgi:uncharacterized protein YdiU (UPF0061 family)